jgi:hypothetical protein
MLQRERIVFVARDLLDALTANTLSKATFRAISSAWIVERVWKNGRTDVD